MRIGVGVKKRSDKLKVMTADLVRELYRPILRGYFAVFALYYAIMSALNYASLSGWDQFYLLGASLFAGATGVMGVVLTGKPLPASKLNLALTAMNFQVVANVAIALNVDFAADKMTYFMIMSMLFALASVSFRQSALSIAIAMLALVQFLPLLDSAAMQTYSYLILATVMASTSTAFFLRKAINNIAESKIEAEERLEDVRVVTNELREKSMSDSLTGLPNRRAFFAELESRIGEAASLRKDDGVWLLLMDLDGFKAVNDIHGHQTGDKLLQKVADRLCERKPDDMHISRMGGDEFNIIATGGLSEDQIRLRCEKLLDRISQTYLIDGRSVKVSCSIGYIRLDPAVDHHTQINYADYALIVAKKQGKNRAVQFDEVHAKEAGVRFRIENALRQAKLEEEMEIVFQPQFRLGTNELISAEVLVRWHNESVGEIEPQRFIEIAEESGLITGITLFVVKRALAEMKSWDQTIPLSINLSSHDLISEPTVDQIIEMVEQSGIDPTLIEFEVTETGMMADLERASMNLGRLAQAGFSIALDDFGTGYSNFSYLRALPIDKLKIDRSFIQSPGDPMTEKILTSLVGMAQVLGVHCLLEGVENEVSLLMAKRAGAELVQGYLFGKPMPSDDLLALASDQLATAKNEVA